MKSKADENVDEQDGEQEAGDENAEDRSSDEDSSSSEPERFERSDNLRRRSEWFQKRTGGR